MATFSQSFTVLAILAREYPKGLTREELNEKAHQADPSRFSGYIGTIDFVLGIGEDGKRQHGLVECWKQKKKRIYYDKTRKVYAPSIESYGFVEVFNNWLRKNNLSHLILFERLNPNNSERCPLGLDWEDIPSPGHCCWNYETEDCYRDCRATQQQIDAKIMLTERRNPAHYPKPHEGD